VVEVVAVVAELTVVLWGAADGLDILGEGVVFAVLAGVVCAFPIIAKKRNAVAVIMYFFINMFFIF
jgi:hypothetical protein